MDNASDKAMSFLSSASFLTPEWTPEFSAWHEHSPFAFWITAVHRPRCLVELGTHWGYSYMAFCQSARQNQLNVTCYAIDTWKGDEQASFYGEEVFNGVSDYNQKHYPEFSTLIRSTFDDARDRFADGSIDLLHIDGLHSYESVKHDFEHWLPKMSIRGIVLFHDTNVHENGFGVWRLWKELALLYPHFEFLHGHGLGILGVGNDFPRILQNLFALEERSGTAESVRNAYAHLGSVISLGVQARLMHRQLSELQASIETLQTRAKQADLKAEELQLQAKGTGLAGERIQFQAQQAILDIERLQYENNRLQRVVELAESWQRSWFRRAFRRWHPPGSVSTGHGFFRRLEISFRKRRNSLARIFLKSRNETPGKIDHKTLSFTDYAIWVRRHDHSRSKKMRRLLTKKALRLPYRPLISVIMPTYNTPKKWLVKAIESVRTQYYPDWELCIADDASSNPEVREVLEHYERIEPRIKIQYRSDNGHIAAATNSALELAHGEFVAFLDHDDELAPHALYAVAAELNIHPHADLIYSDEDKIDEEGVPSDPYFKPDWNPDLLTGQNYICHLAVYRTETVRRTGGLRPGFEGCQDWDLALRITGEIAAKNIIHIPRVLYHWRAIPGSTAKCVNEKQDIIATGIRVLQEHFLRTGQSAEVLHVSGGHLRIQFKLPTPAPLVSIIIPTRNQTPLLRVCIESIRAKTTYPNYEILVVDNQSDEVETLAYFDEIKALGIKIIPFDKPFNYSAINNDAVARASGSVVCLMNNDIEIINADWLEEMVSHALRPNIGAVGAMLFFPDETIQHAGVVIGFGGVAGHISKGLSRGSDGCNHRAALVQNYSAVTAACLVVRKSIYEQVGGLEEERLTVAFNDVDFCLKIQTAGYYNLWTPFARMYHHESASRGYEHTPEKISRFAGEIEYMQSRWMHRIKHDPAYNPNLTLDREDCLLACPPRIPPL
ncbi:MAG: glycosyltransferase [Verrucomicrobiota bacterium]